MWYSYWHYTIIAVFIAIVSGFFNASVRLASQRSIKSMMEPRPFTVHAVIPARCQ